MNQILVTEKLYITPELKRKKKMYKIRFFASIFLIIILCGYYVYAENDRNKSVEVSERILANSWDKNTEKNKENKTDTTTKNIVNDVIIVTLNERESEKVTNQIVEKAEEVTEDEIYTTDSGTEYKIDARLTIPSLDIDYPVISDTSDELLKISLNKYWGGEPNTIGNYCIVGHNYGSGKLFGKLYKMQIGDIAILEDKKGKKVTYEAYDISIVEPDDVSCTSQITNGKREITLITCSNYATQRRVIKCREVL